MKFFTSLFCGFTKSFTSPPPPPDDGRPKIKQNRSMRYKKSIDEDSDNFPYTLAATTTSSTNNPIISRSIVQRMSFRNYSQQQKQTKQSIAPKNSDRDRVQNKNG